MAGTVNPENIFDGTDDFEDESPEIDLSVYDTSAQVDTKIAAIPTTDLSAYDTSSQVDTKISNSSGPNVNDYITLGTTNPLLNENPVSLGHMWVNSVNGNVYICKDNMPDLNSWLLVNTGGDDISPTFSPIGDRGLVGGGIGAFGTLATIQYFNMISSNNSAIFGQLTSARYALGACAGVGRALFAGGYENGMKSVIDYVTISTTSNAITFGNLLLARRRLGSCSSGIRGVFTASDWGTQNEYVTISTSGTANIFGELSRPKSYWTGPSGCSDGTRGIIAGVSRQGGTDGLSIQYITIDTASSASDFGDANARFAAAANDTRAVIAGGLHSGTWALADTIEYITISTTANATNFGHLGRTNIGTVYPGNRHDFSACSNNTNALFIGGATNGSTSPIDFIESVNIMTTMNAVYFGDLQHQYTFADSADSTENAACSGD
jgi:hypothetical protein